MLEGVKIGICSFLGAEGKFIRDGFPYFSLDLETYPASSIQVGCIFKQLKARISLLSPAATQGQRH